MSDSNRRDFLKQSGVGAATLSATSTAYAGKSADSLTVALIGCGGRGTFDAQTFIESGRARLAYICDPDRRRLDQALKNLPGEQPPQAVTDLRRVLDDKSVDAVIVATPDHWHAPASILACDAGKHVYVEKACSHNIREGRLLVEAARRNNRIVQHGTQCRSTKMMIEAIDLLKSGAIGDVLVSKAWNIQRRRSIGRAQPTDVPREFDYDLWVGPAPLVPYQQNRVHGGWHWCQLFGTGGIGNDGVHDLDYARWGLGVETHPTSVSAAGGKFFFDDDQDFPDTQQVSFEYDVDGDSGPGSRKMLIYEQRLWSGNHPYNVDSGVEFYGTHGQMFLSRRGKVEIRDASKRKVNVTIKREPQDTKAHVANFIDAIHADGKPNADVEVAHLTAALCHLGNISTQLGRSLQFDPTAETIVNDDEANRLVSREYRPNHWAIPQNT